MTGYQAWRPTSFTQEKVMETSPLLMTTTEARPGGKAPARTDKDWHYTEEWFPAGQHTPGSYRGQLADVYARHALTFALDVDAYKEGKAEAWEQSATGKYLAGREPYIRRGTKGSMRYLVTMTAEQAAEWWPVASRMHCGPPSGQMSWGEIRSAGIGPCPGAKHPSGDTYDAVPGPDPVQYPLDGCIVMTNVIRFNDELKAALITDGAHGKDDQPAGERTPVDVPDDGETVCTRAAAWLDAEIAEHGYADTQPRGDRARDATVYLKNMAEAGHYVARIIEQVQDRLYSTSDADWTGMWDSAPVKPVRPGEDLSCCGGPDTFGRMPGELMTENSQNGQVHPGSDSSAGAAAELTRPEVPDGMNLDGMYSQWLSEPWLGPDFEYLEPYFEARQAAEKAAREANLPPTRYEQFEAALLDAEGLSKIPPPEPLVSGLLYRDSLAWIGGKPGSGKSFAAVDLGCCTATGTAWHGHAVTQGPVLYVIAEGAAGLSPRVAAWAALNGQKADGIWFLPVRVQVPQTPDLDALARLAARLKPVMIIFDTQAKVSVGLDENSAKDMGEFVDRLEWLREQTGACVLLVHHQPRNAENLRGSTALEGAASTIISAEKDGLVVTLHNDAAHGGKQKDAPEATAVRLMLQASGKSAALSSGLGTASAVLPAGARTVLETLRKLGAGDHSAPQITLASELSKPTVARHLLMLIEKGLVRKTDSNKRPRYECTESEKAVSASHDHGETDRAVYPETSQPSHDRLTDETPSDLDRLSRLSSSQDGGQQRLTSHTPIGCETERDGPGDSEIPAPPERQNGHHVPTPNGHRYPPDDDKLALFDEIRAEKTTACTVCGNQHWPHHDGCTAHAGGQCYAPSHRLYP